MTPRTTFLLLICAVLLAYGAGINGPLMLDDAPNLAQINRWLDGRASWWEAIFGTSSGILGRPVAHFTFWLDAVLTHLKPGHMKLVNVLIHLSCGWLIWRLTTRLATRDQRVAQVADYLGLLVAAVWLLHPLNVSTVLYIVQRMAQLSALFSLLAMWAYVNARESLEAGKTRAGWLWLFIGVPGLTALAALSKENGLLVPLYCAVIEWFLFRQPRPKSVWIFQSGFVVAPFVVGLVALITLPERILAGYSQREWTLTERVLTQCRVLWDYIGQLLLPNPVRMGLFSDDVVASTSVFQPWTTAAGLLGLLALVWLAWYLRARSPLVAVGIALFFAGHAMESTVLPLELAFEHRNYLPAFGLFLAVIAGAAHAVGAHNLDSVILRRISLLALIPLLVLGGMTAQRAWIWGDLKRIALEGVTQHPNSLRAHLTQATILLQTGKFAESAQVMRHLAESNNPKNRAIGFYGVSTVHCIDTNQADAHWMDQADENIKAPVTLFDVQALDLLLRASRDKKCEGVDVARVLQTVERQLALASDQPVTDGPVWRMHLLAASHYAQIGDGVSALRHAELAWQPTADVAAGSVLAQLQMQTGKTGAAEITINLIESRLTDADHLGHAEVSKLRDALSARIKD